MIINITKQSEIRAFVEAYSWVERIDVGSGDFDFTELGCSYIPKPNLTIRGAGRDLTRLFNTLEYNHDPPEMNPGCNFELGDNVWYEDLTLESAAPRETQCCLVGFGSGVSPPHVVSGVRRCILYGRNFGVYNWSPAYGSTMIVDDCDVIIGKHAIGSYNSGGPDAGYVKVYRSRITIDPKRSWYGGGFRADCFGLTNRGGWSWIYDSSINVIPDPEQPGLNFHGLWMPSEGDDDLTGGGNGVLFMRNTELMMPSLNDHCFDLYAASGTILVASGSGSGANGKFKTHKGPNADIVFYDFNKET